MTLTITNISKTYPNGVQALKDIRLSLPVGMFGLLGPNDTGKSTLMRILATLQEPNQGNIQLDNIDVLHQKDELRKTLGYLPQAFDLYPKVSSKKLLNHFAVLKGVTDRKNRKEVVESFLRQVNLWEVRDQKLGGYSGGMKQHVGVALALLGTRRLLIVDEPTAGLNPAEQVRFLNLLSMLAENSVVLLSTHIVEDVSELCTRMAVINQGEILLETEPMHAIAQPRDRIWRRLISKEQLTRMEQNDAVISTKMLARNTLIRVYSESSGVRTSNVSSPILRMFTSAQWPDPWVTNQTTLQGDESSGNFSF